MSRRQEESRLDTLFKGLIIVGIFGMLDLILFGVFGYAGNFVKNFLIGVFGQVIKGYSIAMTLVGLFILLGFKPKIPAKITFNYLLILLVFVCIGHLVTYQEGASLSYTEYLSAMYNSHNTLAGVVVGAIMYPFCKMYTFSLVLFILVLIGLIALVVVNQLDFEIGLKFSSNSKKKEKKLFDFSSKESSSKVVENKPVQTLEMYNGDVNGKLFSNEKVKYAKRRESEDVSIEPIEAIEQKYMTEEEQDSLLSGVSINPVDINTEIQISQERLKMFQEASPVIPIQPVENNTEKAFSQPQEDNIEAEKNKYIPSESDKIYFNSYRRQSSKEEHEQVDINKDIPKMPSYQETFDEIMGLDKEEKDAFKSPSEENDIQEDPFSSLMNRVNKIVDNANNSINKNKVEEKPIEEESFDEEIEKEEIVENKEEIDDVDAKLDAYIKEKEQKEEEEKKLQPPKEPQIRPTFDDSKNIEIKVPESAKPPVEKPKPIITKYTNPSYDILRNYIVEEDSTDYSEKAEALVQALASFKIDVNVTNIIKGPTFSRIEFTVAVGTQLNRITAREPDLLMALAAQSIRILAPIPGTNRCGVEIPNEVRSTVGLKEVMLSEPYQLALKKPTGLTFCFGKDVENRPYFYDLTKAPHLLISGGTGSGKSIAINVMICSLLFRYSPQELRFIFVDPKIVEFSIYKGLPHLLIPDIITEPEKAVNALKWACDEMDRRYKLFENTRTRKIDEYNNLDEVKADPTMKISYLVIIVDEFNEIMLSSVGKQFEALITRLTQKARAAGIHLVLATQRPSVDVISGTIKANLPCKMALRVSSSVDSSVILGTGGAEKLLGNGDMLFFDPNSNMLKRVQGAFIDTPEVDDVVNYVKEHNDSYYDSSVEDIIMKEPEPEPSKEDFKPKQLSMFPDELCIPALEVCIKCQNVSASNLQRRLAIGFQRASKIVDWMIDNGYVIINGVKKELKISMYELEHLKELDNNEGEEE